MQVTLFPYLFIDWQLSYVERNWEWGAEALPSAWALFISLLVWKNPYSFQNYNIWDFFCY